RFGAVKTDVEVGEQEAALNHNPAYLWWASPNGIERNRDRTRKSLSIIEHHPVWYSGVMLRRMYGMVNYGGAAPMVQTPAIAASPNTASLSPGRAVAGLRWPVKVLQRVIRETSLPLILIGAAATLFLSRIRWTLILTVPLYYLIFQSATHTEFRYALPMPYFLFIFAAASWALLPGALMRLRQRTRAGGAVSRI
ncbi:MAG TPA: hypothetical protein VJX67_16675, partial [Blastocatellia bacterium]|nr:hypothetical protein [Blastocatellia bacterium]